MQEHRVLLLSRWARSPPVMSDARGCFRWSQNGWEIGLLLRDEHFRLVSPTQRIRQTLRALYLTVAYFKRAFNTVESCVLHKIISQLFYGTLFLLPLFDLLPRDVNRVVFI